MQPHVRAHWLSHRPAVETHSSGAALLQQSARRVAFPSLAQVYLPRSFLCACPYTKDLRSSPRDLRVCRNEQGWAERRGASCGVTGSRSRKDVQERASGAKSNQAQRQRLISVLDQVITLLNTPLGRLACSTRDPNPLSYPMRTLVAPRYQFQKYRPRRSLA